MCGEIEMAAVLVERNVLMLVGDEVFRSSALHPVDRSGALGTRIDAMR
jgi:hypothetical protein